MPSPRALFGLLLCSAVSMSLAGCGDGAKPRVGELISLEDLAGKTVGVTSLLSTNTLEARYVLQTKYGLSAGPINSDVTLRESPAESLAQLLQDGDIDAAIAGDLAGQTLEHDRDLISFSQVSEEMRDLTGQPVLTSVLVTYPDVARDRRAALEELNRMLTTSVTYFESNRRSILREIAAERDVNRSVLDRWWDTHGVVLGETSVDMQEELLAVWRAAKDLGDVERYPRLRDLLFGLDEAEAAPAGRVTITLAVLDDASRRAALFAIDQSIVESDLIDLSVAYLPASALGDIVAARQFDAIEAEPVSIALGVEQGQEFTILSGGFVDIDSTLAFTRAIDAD